MGWHQPAEPGCAGMLRRRIVSPWAVLPWGSPFPVLSALGFDTSVHVCAKETWES